MVSRSLQPLFQAMQKWEECLVEGYVAIPRFLDKLDKWRERVLKSLTKGNAKSCIWRGEQPTLLAQTGNCLGSSFADKKLVDKTLTMN